MIKRISHLAILICISSISLSAQEPASYYVLIGAFANETNATNFAKAANEKGVTAKVTLNAVKNLYYVYVLNTTERKEAYALSIKLRAETEYKDAWVFEGNLGEEAVKTIPIVETKIVQPIVEAKPEPIAQKPPIDSASQVKAVEKIIKPSGKPFYFKLINAADNTEVKSGEVHIQEAINAPQFQAFKPGEIIYLEAPKNKRGSYNIITQVAGYSPINTVFNYEKPAGQKGSQEETIIELPLRKAKKGDYVDFNNVRFFKDASILQPTSQNELDGLVDLLKENSKYKIKIHGFVNGKQARESFTRGPSSSFFATNPSNDKSGRLSAKELSTKRAETVKNYLVNQGIEAKRIAIKGDGGNVPLYPEGGSLGQFNDRVEIEFTKN